MRDGMRRLGVALLLGLLCGAPASAQSPDRDRSGSRPWSDPPAKPAEAPALPSAAGPAAATATAKNPLLAARPRSVAKPRRAAARPAEREHLAVTRRAIPARIAARATRGAGAPPARRVAGAPPRIAATRPVRYAPPDLQAPTDLWIDARADRIRRARDGGYLVMRRTTIEDATGRRIEVLRPLDDDDE